MTYRMALTPRYYEVDAQGVVFNMWYLGYFDEALPGFLAAGGLSYPDLIAGGHDVMLVRTEVDWRRGLAWQDRAEIGVETVAVGRTSFTLRFTVECDGAAVCSARTTYVVVAAAGTVGAPVPATGAPPVPAEGAQPIPAALRAALGEPAAPRP